jgi:hypothetical protein
MFFQLLDSALKCHLQATPRGEQLEDCAAIDQRFFLTFYSFGYCSEFEGDQLCARIH